MIFLSLTGTICRGESGETETANGIGFEGFRDRNAANEDCIAQFGNC